MMEKLKTMQNKVANKPIEEVTSTPNNEEVAAEEPVAATSESLPPVIEAEVVEPVAAEEIPPVIEEEIVSEV